MSLDSGEKNNPCYKVSTNLAELYSYCNVLWEVVLEKGKVGYLAEELSKQSAEVAQFLPSNFSKMQEEKCI